ncbi:hypothetical protein GBAR_LOCUS1336 [Geodia barretti]|uniref:TIL domain-containing protein n=1 Tax=Geodia barretti TaxID=519541 RepID=A0AA35QWV5_GEOBA|nr:hypothetical protein GBAR_LOCUS1336 [Geodia barretti]
MWVSLPTIIDHWTTRCSVPGQVFSPCKAGCNPTCDNLDPICALACIPGCRCPRGTALEGGRCISAKRCGELSSKPIELPCSIPGQVYMRCGTACPPTCEKYSKPRKCTKQCVRGCQCPRRTVLHQDQMHPSKPMSRVWNRIYLSS